MNIVAKNRWQVRIATGLIFVLGFVAGILALNVYRGLAHRGGPPGNRMEMLAERLQLNEEQKTKVQEIFSDTRQELRALRKESEPRMDEIRRRADGRLQTVLTPEQWQKFQTVREEMRSRRGGRGGPRGDRP